MNGVILNLDRDDYPFGKIQSRYRDLDFKPSFPLYSCGAHTYLE